MGFVLSFWEVGGQSVDRTFAPPAVPGGYEAGRKTRSLPRPESLISYWCDKMKPGDVRKFKHGEGNAVVLAVGLWATRERDLRKVLLENKCWPFGEEGVETEVRS